MKLRWIKTEAEYNGPPVAMIPGYPENGPAYYKLQEWVDNPRAGECAGLDYSEDGKWIDIEVEHP